MDEFLNGDNEEGGDLPSEILIPKYQLQVKVSLNSIDLKILYSLSTIYRISPTKLQS